MKLSKIVAKAAMSMTIKQVNSSCSFIMGQKELPKAAEKLKKF